MPKIKVSRDISVRCNDTSTALYRQGYEGKAPRAHITAIVAAGAGEEVTDGDAVSSEDGQAPAADDPAS
jgi:hypothetical protein